MPARIKIDVQLDKRLRSDPQREVVFELSGFRNAPPGAGYFQPLIQQMMSQPRAGAEKRISFIKSSAYFHMAVRIALASGLEEPGAADPVALRLAVFRRGV